MFNLILALAVVNAAVISEPNSGSTSQFISLVYLSSTKFSDIMCQAFVDTCSFVSIASSLFHWLK